MAELGIDISKGRSKHTDEFRDVDLDRVITVCDNAARNCPVWLGEGHVKHIGFPDPAEAEGTTEERMQVFCRVRENIRREVLAYLQQEDEPGTKGFFSLGCGTSPHRAGNR